MIAQSQTGNEGQNWDLILDTLTLVPQLVIITLYCTDQQLVSLKILFFLPLCRFYLAFLQVNRDVLSSLKKEKNNEKNPTNSSKPHINISVPLIFKVGQLSLNGHIII
jgi:hypothetical protein